MKVHVFLKPKYGDSHTWNKIALSKTLYIFLGGLGKNLRKRADNVGWPKWSDHVPLQCDVLYDRRVRKLTIKALDVSFNLQSIYRVNEPIAGDYLQPIKDPLLGDFFHILPGRVRNQLLRLLYRG